MPVGSPGDPRVQGLGRKASLGPRNQGHLCVGLPPSLALPLGTLGTSSLGGMLDNLEGRELPARRAPEETAMLGVS